MKNYYFKFGYSNGLFNHFYNKNENEIKEGDIISLAIFFDEKNIDWIVEDYYRPDFAEKIQKKGNLDQIKTFFECPFEESYLWVFDKGEIFVFKPISRKKAKTRTIEMFNGYPKLDKYKSEKPKTIDAELILKFDWNRVSLLPESFATINSNQSYNRKTIKKFKGNESIIAEYLVRNWNSKEKLSILYDKRLNYLSPIQFETLIFLIFHHNDCFVSTFRGGTRKDIDLVICPNKDIDLLFYPNKESVIFQKGENYNLQIKIFEASKAQKGEADYLIHTGETFLNKNMLGKDWIEEQLHNSIINNWLNQSLKFFHIKK